MDKQEFNKLCGDYMGLELFKSSNPDLEEQYYSREFTTYSPYDDLNQMTDVVDKIMAEKSRNLLIFVEVGCKHAMRKFITDCLTHETPRWR